MILGYPNASILRLESAASQSGVLGAIGNQGAATAIDAIIHCCVFHWSGGGRIIYGTSDAR